MKNTIEAMREKIPPFSPDMTFDDMMEIFSKMKLREMLHEYSVDVNEDQLDKILGAIPNI